MKVFNETRYVVKSCSAEEFLAVEGMLDWNTTPHIYDAALFHQQEDACLMANSMNIQTQRKYVALRVETEYKLNEQGGD